MGIKWIFAVLAAVAATGAAARPTAPERAVRGAEAWAEKSPRCRRAPTGEARTFSIDGTNLFHLVALEGGGFVTMSADEAEPSVMGFSPSGGLPEMDEGNPLWALLCGTAARARGIPPREAMRRRPVRTDTRTVASGRAARLSAGTAKAAENPITTTLDDVRVVPLVETKWNQGDIYGEHVYNYYTTNNWPCGCTATAMAQLMRFHRHPTDPVQANTYTCFVRKETSTGEAIYLETEMTMKGGVYQWNLMSSGPAGFSDEEREAIGRVCYDASVAMHSDYSSIGTGALGGFAFAPLKDDFHYANAKSYVVNEDSEVPTSAIPNTILANLDAGYPVLLGITGSGTGHSVIADGYGYADGVLYCHLNMGWSGYCDYWYALPAVPTPNYNFNAIAAIVYNIFPDRTGELVTGRITDMDGNPVAGATVAATIGNDDGIFTASATTSESGIYAIFTPGNATNDITIAATAGNLATVKNITTQTSPSNAPDEYDLDYGYFEYYDGLLVGNSWGNDLVVGGASVVAASIGGFTGGGDISLSFSGTPAARYKVEWSECLTNQNWNVYTNILVGTDGAATISIPVDKSREKCFYRIVY